VIAEGTGGRPTVLVLRQGHADLQYVLLRGSRELDRHVWGATSGDPALLAEATARAESDLRPVLSAEGSPADALARFGTVLGLPTEVPDLLAGRAVPTAEEVVGQGLVGGLRAAVRGDYAPPPGEGSWVDRWLHLARRRPGWYRALNAVEAVLFAVLAWVLLRATDGDLVSWRGGLALVAGLLALGCLYDTRPLRAAGDSRERTATTPSG